MAETIWKLTDRTDQTYVQDLNVTPEQVPGSATGYRVEKRRLGGGPGDGVDVVDIDNGALRFAVLPTRGMGLWKAWLGDQPIGWNSPVHGPIHPALVPLTDPGGLGWLEGFDELLVRCGLESNGAPQFDDQGTLVHGLHGRIANKPAHRVELRVDGETGEIELRGVVDEFRFHFLKLRLHTTIRTRVGANAIEIQDTIENCSASSAEFQLLYHINIGPPVLGPQAAVVAPVETVVPRNARACEGLARWAEYEAPVAGYEEQVYFFELQTDPEQQTAVLLKSAQGDRGVGVRFNVQQLPCFTLWKNQTAEPDGYVTGLEPATNFPNPRDFEKQQGRVVPLEPGESRQFDLRLEAYGDATQVADMEQHIQLLRQNAPVMHEQPQSSWCSEA